MRPLNISLMRAHFEISGYRRSEYFIPVPARINAAAKYLTQFKFFGLALWHV